MNKSPVRFYFSAPHARAECLAPMRRAKLDAPRAGDAEQTKNRNKTQRTRRMASNTVRV